MKKIMMAQVFMLITASLLFSCSSKKEVGARSNEKSGIPIPSDTRPFEMGTRILAVKDTFNTIVASDINRIKSELQNKLYKEINTTLKKHYIIVKNKATSYNCEIQTSRLDNTMVEGIFKQEIESSIFKRDKVYYVYDVDKSPSERIFSDILTEQFLKNNSTDPVVKNRKVDLEDGIKGTYTTNNFDRYPHHKVIIDRVSAANDDDDTFPVTWTYVIKFSLSCNVDGIDVKFGDTKLDETIKKVATKNEDEEDKKDKKEDEEESKLSNNEINNKSMREAVSKALKGSGDIFYIYDIGYSIGHLRLSDKAQRGYQETKTNIAIQEIRRSSFISGSRNIKLIFDTDREIPLNLLFLNQANKIIARKFVSEELGNILNLSE